MPWYAIIIPLMRTKDIKNGALYYNTDKNRVERVISNNFSTTRVVTECHKKEHFPVPSKLLRLASCASIVLSFHFVLVSHLLNSFWGDFVGSPQDFVRNMTGWLLIDYLLRTNYWYLYITWVCTTIGILFSWLIFLTAFDCTFSFSHFSTHGQGR